MKFTEKQTLRGLFVEGNDLRICNLVRRWWAYNQDGTLEGLAHHAQTLLHLQGGQSEKR